MIVDANKYSSSKWGFQLAIILLFVRMPVLSIWIFQEYYWEISDIFRITFRIAIEGSLILLLIYSFLHDLLRNKLNRPQIITFILVSFLLIYITIVIISNWGENALKQVNLKNLKLASYYGIYYIIGYFLIKGEIGTKWVKQILFAGLALMTLQIIIFYNFNTFSIDYENAQQKGYIHLSLGDSYAIWSILTLSIIKRKNRFIFYLITLLFLFLLSSRGAFYCYLLAAPFLARTNKQGFISFLPILILGIVILSFSFIIYDHRMFPFVYGSDLSLQFRITILKTNLPDILKNWFLGDYCGYLRYDPPANNYLHNILSIWRQFGLIPMVLTLTLIMLSFLDVRSHFTGNKPETIKFIIIALFIYLLSATVFAKGYNYVQLFLIFGFIGSGITNYKFLSPKNPIESHSNNNQ